MSFTAAHRGGAGPPLLLLHGFTDTWRTWELVLPALERERDVLALTLPGHAGGPPLGPDPDVASVLDALEAAMDDAGLETADIAGNSLGGHLALALAARGRARSVVALAPAGGWDPADTAQTARVLEHFVAMRAALEPLAPQAEALLATPEGRRRATRDIAVHWEHIPAELLAHQLRGVVGCRGMEELLAGARRTGWPLDPVAIGCPLRIVWGSEDRLLPWPAAAERYRAWFSQADWVVLDDVGHCPQLDLPLETAQLILGFGGS